MHWRILNSALAEELGIDLTALYEATKTPIFAGNRLLEGAEPLAQPTQATSSVGSCRDSATAAR